MREHLVDGGARRSRMSMAVSAMSATGRWMVVSSGNTIVEAQASSTGMQLK